MPLLPSPAQLAPDFYSGFFLPPLAALYQLATFNFADRLSLVFCVTGCGKPPQETPPEGMVYRLNFAVVTIQNAFWQEETGVSLLEQCPKLKVSE